MNVLIWWLNQQEHEAIDELPDSFPEYLKEQFESRQGRGARGRLWVADEFGDIDCSESDWTTPLARFVAKDSGGIVIHAKDAALLKTMPGILTTLNMERAYHVNAS